MPERFRPTTDMSDKHEKYVNDMFGLKPTRGSGNQAKNPLDGRHNQGEVHFAFGADCKSTEKASISVSLAMWDKLVAQGHGLRPMLPLRFYGNQSLSVVKRDLVVVDLEDFHEVWESAEKYEDLADS